MYIYIYRERETYIHGRYRELAEVLGQKVELCFVFIENPFCGTSLLTLVLVSCPPAHTPGLDCDADTATRTDRKPGRCQVPLPLPLYYTRT